MGTWHGADLSGTDPNAWINTKDKERGSEMHKSEIDVRFFSLVMIVWGFLTLAWAAFASWRTRRFEAAGLRAEGTVRGHKSEEVGS